MIMAFLLGCVLGVGCAYGAEFLDGSFKEADEVREALGLPILGSISKIVTPQDVLDRVQLWKNRAWVAATAAICLVVGLAMTTFLVR
jgi:capsular polysaccharide biosynthesis protein